MTCRKCGTEIAEKALICYKCGTATTEARFKPAAIAPAGGSRQWVLTAVTLVLLAVLAAFVGRSGNVDESPRWVTYAAVSAGVLVVGLRAWLRRRR